MGLQHAEMRGQEAKHKAEGNIQTKSIQDTQGDWCAGQFSWKMTTDWSLIGVKTLQSFSIIRDLDCVSVCVLMWMNAHEHMYACG